MFFSHFLKGDNFCDFLFASPANERGPLLKERICSLRSKFLSLRVDLKREGRQKAKM